MANAVGCLKIRTNFVNMKSSVIYGENIEILEFLSWKTEGLAVKSTYLCLNLIHSAAIWLFEILQISHWNITAN